MILVDGDTLRAVAPRFSGANAAAQAGIIAGIESTLQSTLETFDINSRLRIAHFLAQITEEAAAPLRNSPRAPSTRGGSIWETSIAETAAATRDADCCS